MSDTPILNKVITIAEIKPPEDKVRKGSLLPYKKYVIVAKELDDRGKPFKFIFTDFTVGGEPSKVLPKYKELRPMIDDMVEVGYKEVPYESFVKDGEAMPGGITRYLVGIRNPK